jgi:hypothetical protein
MKTAYPLTINFSENCVQFLPVPCFICQSKCDHSFQWFNNHQVKMYEIAWLQFVIKIFCQEMHKLQKLDRCEDSVELLSLFESSARDSVTESCSRWLTTTS